MKEYVRPKPIYEYEDGCGIWSVINQGCEMEYWYSTSPCDIDGDCSNGHQFDVRELPQYERGKDHIEIIVAAVDAGDLELTDDAFPAGEIDFVVTMIYESDGAEGVPVDEKIASARDALRQALVDRLETEGLHQSVTNALRFFSFNVRP